MGFRRTIRRKTKVIIDAYVEAGLVLQKDARHSLKVVCLWIPEVTLKASNLPQAATIVSHRRQLATTTCRRPLDTIAAPHCLRKPPLPPRRPPPPAAIGRLHAPVAIFFKFYAEQKKKKNHLNLFHS
ncbi:hypothetical protein KFK09_023081 [Dendrobium nobile]|uniref:Uncharacterized protein n=1 Tax=Dendrobium nobile TaxID=94219 RepID=A0A8T3AKG4_DENNO|nr:hypothetical protein KFK09_023081 [Dendrobium nobile]